MTASAMASDDVDADGWFSAGNSWADRSDTWNNLTLDEYLQASMGPQHLPLRVVLPVSAVYAAIFVSGVVGNVAVCAVIVRMPELHTATNYYLFSLAVSDLALLLLGLPNEMSMFWQQYPWPLGEPLCKFRAIVSEMVSYTSVLTIVAFSTERYLAICHPLYAYSMKGLRRALLVIGSIWLLALGAAAPFGAYTKVSYLEFPPRSGKLVADSAFCAMLQEDVPDSYPVYELSMLFFFLLPMVALVVLYTRMAAALWWPQRRGHALRGAVHRRSGTGSAGRRSVVKMLAAVVVAFFLCWAPFHLQRLLYLHARDWDVYQDVHEVMFFVTGCLYYFSSTVNPILYNVMSARYRHAFRRTLCCLPPAAPGRRIARDASSFQESTTYSSMYAPSRRLTSSSGARTPAEGASTPHLPPAATTAATAATARLPNGANGAGDWMALGAANGKRNHLLHHHHHHHHLLAHPPLVPAAGDVVSDGDAECANCVADLPRAGETGL